ncbi:MAG: hypothetical protein AAF515_19440 [Pseudomonadota bacterium]
MADIFLRLGVTLVAFMVIIGHLLWLSILPQIDCSADGSELWRALFWMAPLTLTFALLLLVSRKLPSIVQSIKFACVPVALLLPLALYGILPTLSASSIGGQPICAEVAGYTSLLWERSWAPAQLFLVFVIAVQVWRYWRMAAKQAEAKRLGQP